MDLTDYIYVFMYIHSYMCNNNSSRIEEKTWKGRSEKIKLSLKGLSEPRRAPLTGSINQRSQKLTDW